VGAARHRHALARDHRRLSLRAASEAMYLNTVLQSLESVRRKLVAEDLYKLNEAIFNLPEEDTIDQRTSTKLFMAITQVQDAFSMGRYDKNDPNFFYDYVALLATMQNQHFFTQRQNKQMLDWLLQVIAVDTTPEPVKPVVKAAPAPSLAKDIARVETENAELSKHIQKMRELSDAVAFIQKFKASTPEAQKSEEDEARSEARRKKKRDRTKKRAGGGGGGEAPSGDEADEAVDER
jgi:hypothetical protein